MSITIQDFKTRLHSKIHSGTLNKVQDIYNLIFEGAGNVLNAVDPAETIRIVALSNTVYDDVYNYAAPADLKGKKVIDIRPQANRTRSDNFLQNYSREFDQYKLNDSFAIENNSGVKTIRISKNLDAGATLNDSNTLTENGTWAADGTGASGLTVDSLNKVSGSASLKFDLAITETSGYIENSTITAVDLTNYVNTGAIFVWVYLPSATISAINLAWGSDSSNYLHRSVTASHDNTDFVIGWNLLRFDWSGSTAVGTSVNTAIDYLKVTFTYDGTVAIPSCRVDNIVARLGTIYETVYYSKYLFQSASGTWKEVPTADDDVLNLDTTGINVLLYEVSQLVSQELQGESMASDINYFSDREKQQIDDYVGNNKSQAIKPQSNYYRMPYMRRR